MASPMPLRIAVVQFAPKIGQIQSNLSRARELCRKLKPRSIDVLLFPELVLSGYNFPNASAISPYLELPKIGPTSLFCSELAEQLKCYVFAGYPERLVGDEAPTHISPDSEETKPTTHNSESTPVAEEVSIVSNEDTQSATIHTEEGHEEREPTRTAESEADVQILGANSAVLYGPGGEWVGHYRKTNLFETDRTWAKAGSGFATFHLPSPLRTISLGICNDLNPIPSTPWTIEDGPYEMADYALSQGANTCILLNSWLDSGKEEDEDTDWHTLNYWAARLRPLWDRADGITEDEQDSGVGHSGDAASEQEEPEGEQRGDSSKEMIVVVCNRTGEENGKTFAGSSAIYSMKQGSGGPKLLDMMGRKEEGVRVWNISV